MNTGKSREENFDPDFERRIRISRVALSVLLTLTSIWTAVFLILNDLTGAAILGSLSLLYALCLFLYQMGYLLFAGLFGCLAPLRQPLPASYLGNHLPILIICFYQL